MNKFKNTITMVFTVKNFKKLAIIFLVGFSVRSLIVFFFIC